MTDPDLDRRRLLLHAAGIAAGATLAPGAATGAPRAPQTRARRRVIIDTDPGVDDALAIFLALRSPELQVEAITPVAGNVGLELTLPNALRLLEIAGHKEIPVAAGAAQPLERELVTAPAVHGNNGLAGVEFPQPTLKPVAESAHQLIRRIVSTSPGEISLIAIGPLTNLALAFREDPQLPAQLRDITIMGGSLSGGNITPAAEFNTYVDPEAAQIVYASGAPITMVGLDVTRKAELTDAHIRTLEAARDPAGRAAGRIMRATLATVQRTGGNNGRVLVHDAMTVAALIDPSLVRVESLRIEIETQGERTAGETVGYRKAPLRRSAPLR
ncbi:MAG TPA: nucleoside hydrolase, partial [Steroidobacteraceae bacterium]|nr:nucleoside hydrolase [Steroidobacteraceae bacterium]